MPDLEQATFTGWTAATSYNVVTTSPYLRDYNLAAMAGSGLDLINRSSRRCCGQIITATCYINAGSAPSGATGGCALAVYESGHTHIATYVRPPRYSHRDNRMGQGDDHAAHADWGDFVAVGARCSNTSASDMFVDNFSWDLLVNPYDSPELFLRGSNRDRKVRTHGADVDDNTAEHQRRHGHLVKSGPTSILWQTEPLMKSGSLEPGTFGGPPPWPTVPGQSVHDTLSTPPSGMDWLAVTPQVIDPNDPTLPPQGKYVVAAASKIFVLNGDIANYCATTNPLDWTSTADAGFLPIGLNSYGTNPFTAAGLYRSNLVFFNSQGLQMWQVDEDPANMALLDAIPIGCTQHRSLASVNNDLFFLSAQGDRTMGISAGSGNLQAGDVGMPIDPLVQAATLWAAANGVTPIGGYFPSFGQRFLAFPNWPADGLFWSSGGSGAASGTNTYAVSLSGITAYRVGQFYCVTFINAATGASTLNINGIGDKTIEDHTKITAGSKWFVYYDDILDRFNISGGITRVFVYTMSRVGEVGAWSHYLFQHVLEELLPKPTTTCICAGLFSASRKCSSSTRTTTWTATITPVRCLAIPLCSGRGWTTDNRDRQSSCPGSMQR